MQGIQVRALLREDPTCCGATKPLRQNYWSLRALEPVLHNEKPPQWEAHALQQRVAPALWN